MSVASCHSACLTCSDISFFNCTSCIAPLQLYSGTCLSSVNYAIQLASTLCIVLFIIPQMLHVRRFLVLSLVFDMVQIVGYFKYFTAYDPNRNFYMMLSGRGWGNWSEGWYFTNINTGVGVWSLQEGDVDKAIRVACMFAGIMILTFLLGILKMITGEQGVTLAEFWRKNWLNSLMLGAYLTTQDMAFIVANKFYFNSSQISQISSTSDIIDLTIAIVFGLVMLMQIICLTYIINTMPTNYVNQNFCHANMFLFNFDTDCFPNYYKLEHPDDEATRLNELAVAKIWPVRSNMRIVCFLMKMIYPFVMIATLNGSDDQLMPSAAFIVFWVALVWTSMPFQPKHEWSQIILLSLSHAITIALVYLYGEGLLSDIITMAVMFAYIGIGLLSVIIQIFYSYYKLLPVDLYNTGMKINISIGDPILQRERNQLQAEKRRLEQEMRRKQEEGRKRMLEMDDEQRKREQLRLEQQKKMEAELERLRRQMDEEQDKYKRQLLEQKQKALLSKQNENMTEDQAALQARKAQLARRIRDKYRIDASRLNSYQWDRKRKFVYSNKMTRD